MENLEEKFRKYERKPAKNIKYRKSVRSGKMLAIFAPSPQKVISWTMYMDIKPPFPPPKKRNCFAAIGLSFQCDNKVCMVKGKHCRNTYLRSQSFFFVKISDRRDLHWRDNNCFLGGVAWRWRALPLNANLYVKKGPDVLTN